MNSEREKADILFNYGLPLQFCCHLIQFYTVLSLRTATLNTFCSCIIRHYKPFMTIFPFNKGFASMYWCEFPASHHLLCIMRDIWSSKQVLCLVKAWLAGNLFRKNDLETLIQWNLIIKRSDITKPSYNKVILLVPALYVSLLFYPDIMRNLI